jgi:3-deoxy-D-manno-octulosonate 8-phosphate phosphatase (KDO 8-P phosphatase)
MVKESATLLDSQELVRRAGCIKLVLTDCDGVLTDQGVYYSSEGEALKRFSIRDGMGVERLRNAGVDCAIITGETSGSVQRRAEKLHIEAYLGVKHKVAALERILGERGLHLGEIAFMGDDVNDLGVIEQVGREGLVGAPGDAMPQVLERVHFRSQARGGQGAFRELAEWILRLRKAAVTNDVRMEEAARSS